MENPKESKGKVIIKPRPPKGMVEEEAPMTAIGPEEAPDMAPIQPCAETPAPCPEAPAPAPAEAPAPKPAKKCNKK